MAPRGRSARPRLSRMDAALDAMRPMGFGDELVRRTVKSLLREYGGDDGWPFIESDAYKVLLDAILEQNEEEEKTRGRNLLEGSRLVSEHDEGGYALALTSSSSAPAAELAEVQRNISVCQSAEANQNSSPIKECERRWKDIGTCGPEKVGRSSRPQVSSTLPTKGFAPVRARKPCYGWIDPEDEEEDFIQLEPAPRLTSPQVEILGGDTGKRHKSG